MTPEQVKAIWEQVKAMGAKEAACPSHDFQRVEGESHPLRKKWKCSGCGFEIRNVEHFWYERGRRDALSDVELEKRAE